MGESKEVILAKESDPYAIGIFVGVLTDSDTIPVVEIDY